MSIEKHGIHVRRDEAVPQPIVVLPFPSAMRPIFLAGCCGLRTKPTMPNTDNMHVPQRARNVFSTNNLDDRIRCKTLDLSQKLLPGVVFFFAFEDRNISPVQTTRLHLP